MTPLTALERIEYERMIRAYVAGRGRDNLPPIFGHELDRLDAIGRRSKPSDATAVGTPRQASEGDLVTFSDVATQLAVSARTVGRHVAAGRLTVIGRRITRASLERLTCADL